VEVRAAHSDAGVTGETGFDVGGGVLEPDALEEVSVGLVEVNSELREHFARVGHQALAAGFFDAGWASLDDRAFDTALAEGDGSGEACRATTDDQDFCRRRLRDGFTYHSGDLAGSGIWCRDKKASSQLDV
jgi:hypothetical protein